MRIDQARAFLEVAELVGDEPDDLASPGVAAALAVLAGIAAADAACCARLGVRSRGQDHRQAVELLAQVGSDGRSLGRTLDRLLDIKDGAHYGAVFVSRQKATAAVRQARVLVDAATLLVRG
ncbi:MAG: hypothetical protein ACRDT4_19390 [Micromonosporaceae bacterium]